MRVDRVWARAIMEEVYELQNTFAAAAQLMRS